MAKEDGRGTEIPVVVEAAASLKATGEYTGSFDGSQATELVRTMVGSLVEGANADGVSVRIEGDRGTVSGNVTVKKGIASGTVGLGAELGNNPDGSGIQLVGEPTIEPQGMVAKAALAIPGVRPRIEAALSNPGGALGTTLGRVLAREGAHVSGSQFSLKDGALKVRLTGGPAQAAPVRR